VQSGAPFTEFIFSKKKKGATLLRDLVGNSHRKRIKTFERKTQKFHKVAEENGSYRSILHKKYIKSDLNLRVGLLF